MINLIKLPKLLQFIRRFDFSKKLGVLEKIYGNQLQRLGQGWVTCSNGVIWKLNLEDPCHRWIIYGKYEGGAGIDFALDKLKNGGIYIESGANIGQWLLFIANMKNVKSLAFEPVSSERNWLDQCVNKQRGWDVSILPFGLGSKEGYLEIQQDGPRSTLKLDWYQGKNFGREKVEIRRLENVLEDIGVEKITFWKLDVEGAELEAIKGVEKLLANKKIEYIYFECHPDNYTAVSQLLGKYNYCVYDLVKGNLLLKSEKKILKTENLVAALRNDYDQLS